MPIHEKDPWRVQYFEGVECPPDVFIPTDDADAYRWFRRYRWIYNKLLVCESQGLECAPHGIEPRRFPVFSKPIVNLEGMGVGSRLMRNRDEYCRHRAPGQMWMPVLSGEHVSSDVAVVNGNIGWFRHTVGLPLAGGTFDYWVVEAGHRPALEARLRGWVRSSLQGYTGMLNVETIGARIIDAHLRFADQWPDLYGDGWLEAAVRLYSRGEWSYADTARRTGYSVVLFGPHSRLYSHPPAAIQADIRRRAGISSLQLTFHEDRPAESHAMPPGGFRLAVINAWDLAAGLDARERLAASFGIDANAGQEKRLAESA